MDIGAACLDISTQTTVNSILDRRSSSSSSSEEEESRVRKQRNEDTGRFNESSVIGKLKNKFKYKNFSKFDLGGYGQRDITKFENKLFYNGERGRDAKISTHLENLIMINCVFDGEALQGTNISIDPHCGDILLDGCLFYQLFLNNNFIEIVGHYRDITIKNCEFVVRDLDELNVKVKNCGGAVTYIDCRVKVINNKGEIVNSLNIGGIKNEKKDDKATISFVSFNKSSFKNGRLKDVRFSNCEFDKVDFSGINLNNVEFSNSTFLNVSFDDIKKATIIDCSLNGKNIHHKNY